LIGSRELSIVAMLLALIKNLSPFLHESAFRWKDFLPVSFHRTFALSRPTSRS
jgi:hypothetical protein